MDMNGARRYFDNLAVRYHSGGIDGGELAALALARLEKAANGSSSDYVKGCLFSSFVEALNREGTARKLSTRDDMCNAIEKVMREFFKANKNPA